MSETAVWYYVGSFGQLGPLTKEQLEELVEGGVIEPNTYVWKPGMPDWLPASSVIELDPIFKKYIQLQSPPPIPGTPAPPMPMAPTFDNFPRTPATPYRHGLPTNLQRSDKSRTLSGILQLIFPGVGRIYMGYAALGVIQLVLSFATCGLLHLWSIVDGVLILSGQVRLDGYGRALED